MKPMNRTKIIVGGTVFVLCCAFAVSKLMLHLPWYMILLVYGILIGIWFLLFPSACVAALANYYCAIDKTDKAQVYLESAIKKRTKSPAVYLNYAVLLIKNGKAEEALFHLEKAHSLNKGHKTLMDKNILLTKGSCYWALGHVDKAIDTLKMMESKHQHINDVALTTLGYMYFIKGDEEMALQYTQKAIEESPKFGAAWDNLGQIYLRENKSSEAKEAFVKAISFKMDLVDSHYYLGVIAQDEQDYPLAASYFKAAKGCHVSALNTVTEKEIEEKLQKLENMLM